jgi:outer membrane beta-barrel protein
LGALFILSLGSTAPAQNYEKATEGDLVVRGKLMPKQGKVELNADFGLILNQSYVDTFLVHGSLNYYWSELWGFSLEGAIGLNSDKEERECIENFYNNPQQAPGDSCPVDGVVNIPEGGNYGPAYVPIREINTLVFGNLIWNPVYGKQLLLLRKVLHFDLYLVAGGGVAMSTYYDKQQQLKNGKPSRKPAPEFSAGQTAEQQNIGCRPDETNCYGIDGRPDPVEQTNPLIDFGIGQKIHFTKNFNLKFELRNMTLLGTPTGFENLFALWGGLAVRF